MSLKSNELYQVPSFIHLYDEGSAKTLDVKEIAQHLRARIPKTRVDIRGDFPSHYLHHLQEVAREKAIEELAKQLAGIRIRDPYKADSFTKPLYGEIEFEKRGLKDPKSRPFGVLYDGFALCSILRQLIRKQENSWQHLHIVFTNRLFGTWDRNDKRYHARVSIYSFPCLVSTTGIVEAPAKPKEFYISKQRYATMGMTDAVLWELKQRFQGQFIDHEDERLTEVMKGYALQAWFYHVTGNPFCENRNCRLYNAHWQEEVIQAQLQSEREFCQKHQTLLDKIRCKIPSFFAPNA